MARVKTQLRRKKYQDDLRNQLEQSVNLAIKDGLTGIFNRRYFDSHIIQMVKIANETGRPLHMLMMDIDHFKKVNDNYGHQAGDEVLKTFAEVLKNNLRVTDLIARYGGEEFALLISDTSQKDAEIAAERVRAKVSELDFYIPGNKIIRNTVSIGMTCYKTGEEVTNFIDRADKALYESKSSGRNRLSIR